MQRTAFIATIVSLVTGCMVSTSQLGPMTSGHIGCTPEQTVVFNRQSHVLVLDLGRHAQG